MKANANHTDVYELVTNKIIEQLEKGIVPWNKPWHGIQDGAYSYATGKPYSLLNQLLLEDAGAYLTFNQIKEAGGKIRKGAKAKMVVFYKQCKIVEKVIKEDGSTEILEKLIPVLRYYNVFHISDTENVPSKEKDMNTTLQTDSDAEKIVNDYVAREHINLQVIESNKAYFSPSLDKVVVPLLEQFDAVSEFYSTLFHELTHSTGVEKRLKRDMGKRFGSESYSKEELVAEIGSSFLTQIVGFDCRKTFENSVAYLQAWIQVLKGDKRLIVSATSKAQKAVDYILGANLCTE